MPEGKIEKQKVAEAHCLEEKNQDLSAKEKLSLLKKYHETCRRIENAKETFLRCQELAQKHPENPRYQKLLGKAKDTLSQIEKEFHVFLSAGLQPLQTIERSLYTEMLAGHNIRDLSFVNQLYGVQPDAEKAIRLYEDLLKTGMPVASVKQWILRYKDPYFKQYIADDVQFFRSVLKLQVDVGEMIQLRDYYFDDNNAQFVQTLHRLGVRSEFASLRSADFRNSVAQKRIKILCNNGITDGKTLAIADRAKLPVDPSLVATVQKIKPYAQTLQKHGIWLSSKAIADSWLFSEDPYDAIDLNTLKKEYKIFNSFSGFYSKDKEVKEDAYKLFRIFQSLLDQTKDDLLHLAAYAYKETMRAENLEGFLQEPALPLCEKVYRTMTHSMDWHWKAAEYALKIGRNLYLKGFHPGDSVDKKIIDKEFMHIEDLQEKNSNIRLFKDRNVVFIHNGERWKKEEDTPSDLVGKSRFAYPELLADFQKSVGKNGHFEAIGPSQFPTTDELVDIKRKALIKITETPPPMTCYFNGHGGPRELYVNNGATRDGNPYDHLLDFLSADEFSLALAMRNKKFAGQRVDLAQDIFIFGSCFNHTFLRNVIAQNSQLGNVQPIMMGNSEYGQYGFTDFNSENNAYYRVLNVGQEDVTLGNVIENERYYQDSDFTVYIPDEQGIPQQIVEGEKKPDAGA